MNKNSHIVLSIVIPYYNTKYIADLVKALFPQLTPEVEVLIIDDGSTVPLPSFEIPENVRLFCKDNGGAASARNEGIENATGDYIAFIDADDLVAPNYVATILQKIRTESPDYIYLSWKTLPGGWQKEVRLMNVTDEFPPYNLCVWNRIYKAELIGQTRFNEDKPIAEDAEFIRAVEKKGRKAFISDFMYYYRSGAEDSLTKRYARGEVEMQRVVYHIPHVTADMTHLLKEFQDIDKTGEVILLTEQNDLPELARHAMIMQPQTIRGTELRGEPFPLFSKIPQPVRVQVAIYTDRTHEIGGIETWIYNFCQQMRKYYDIAVVYSVINTAQLNRLRKIVRTVNLGTGVIFCDTLIINRITDKIPDSIKYRQSVQMVHAMKLVPGWKVPEDRDKVVAVSDAVKRSFELQDAETIRNMTYPEDPERVLFLISATRGTFEKGYKRMELLADALTVAGIRFMWLLFTDKEPDWKIDSVICRKPVLNIAGYIARADYLVQLSDNEGFCYSIVEALELGTPVITTPIEVLPELGFEEGKHGYIVPFDMQDPGVERFLNVPEKESVVHCQDNVARVKQWRKLIGSMKPKKDYTPPKLVKIRVVKQYKDVELGRAVKEGEVLEVYEDRAEVIIGHGFGKGIE